MQHICSIAHTHTHHVQTHYNHIDPSLQELHDRLINPGATCLFTASVRERESAVIAEVRSDEVQVCVCVWLNPVWLSVCEVLSRLEEGHTNKVKRVQTCYTMTPALRVRVRVSDSLRLWGPKLCVWVISFKVPWYGSVKVPKQTNKQNKKD